jgi:hypothetical protein
MLSDSGVEAESICPQTEGHPVALAEVQASADCIVSSRNQGGFSTVLPGFPGNVRVKGVVEIQVKQRATPNTDRTAPGGLR